MCAVSYSTVAVSCSLLRGYVEAIREIEAQVENGLAAGVPTIDHIAMACGRCDPEYA